MNLLQLLKKTSLLSTNKTFKFYIKNRIQMSLTSFISDKNFQELRDKFKTVFPKPQINLTGNLIAPPLTKNYSVVGQAFDYILRFTLEYKNKTKIISNEAWVADESFRMIKNSVEKASSKTIKIGYRSDFVKDRIEFLSMLKEEYSNAKQNYQKFLSDGVLTDSLIKSSLFLARLDTTYRAGFIDQSLGNENDLDIQDIRQLLDVLKEKDFKVREHCFINPTFGNGSILVEGADADLIIDDTLIDIKVTKNLVIERDYFNQIIGYYILSLIGGINEEEDYNPIKNIGLYFARHATLWKIPIDELADQKTIFEFRDWFVEYANKYIWYGQLDKTMRIDSLIKKRTFRSVKLTK